MSKLIRYEIQDDRNTDCYKALAVYNDSEAFVQQTFQTIGEAARDVIDNGVPVYNCTGRRLVNRRNIITANMAESGELG